MRYLSDDDLKRIEDQFVAAAKLAFNPTEG